MTSLLATLLANPHDPDIRLIYAGAVEDGKCELPAVDLRGGKVVHDQYGVPLRVKATMVTWCGESCFACQSTGRLNVVLRLGDGFTSVPCSKCNGTGRILGIAAAVCGAWPITGVELTDFDISESHAALLYGRRAAGLPDLQPLPLVTS